jgi:hypothetical protein
MKTANSTTAIGGLSIRPRGFEARSGAENFTGCEKFPDSLGWFPDAWSLSHTARQLLIQFNLRRMLMTRISFPRRLQPYLLTSAALLLVGGLAAAQGQTTDTEPKTPPSGTPQTRGRGMMMDDSQRRAMMAERQALMAERQKMMTDLQAADQKLNGLVAKMDAAKGPEKVDAIAAVVKQLVADRASMHGSMMNMQGHMMGMMGNMMGGPAQPEKKDAPPAGR